MKAVPTDWTVVIIGNWNVSIFNPDWVAKNLFQEDRVEVEVGLGSGQTTLRVRSASAILIPLNDRIIIGMRSDDKELVDQLESYAVRVLSLLPHTPVASYGVNFGYVETQPEHDLLRVFDLSDTGRISDIGHEITRTVITRSLPFEAHTLNFRQALREGHVHFHFNFHKDVGSAAEAGALLPGKVGRFCSFCPDLLAALYGLQEEEGGEHENIRR